MFKGSLVSWCKTRDCVPGKYTPPALEPVSMETIQETGEILVFADINSRVAQLVRL